MADDDNVSVITHGMIGIEDLIDIAENNYIDTTIQEVFDSVYFDVYNKIFYSAIPNECTCKNIIVYATCSAGVYFSSYTTSFFASYNEAFIKAYNFYSINGHIIENANKLAYKYAIRHSHNKAVNYANKSFVENYASVEVALALAGLILQKRH